MARPDTRPATANARPAPVAAAVLATLEIGTPPIADVYRHLGYPADAGPKPRTGDRIEVVSGEATALLRPAGAYAVHALTSRSDCQVELGGTSLRGEIGRYLGSVDRVAVVVATAGFAVSDLAARYGAEGDSLAAWIADAIGSWAAEAAADAVTERVRATLGADEAATLRYSPGYCGMSLGEQQAVFGLVDAAAAGIELLPSMLMKPLKSVSGIVGIGAAEALAAQPASPCDVCGRVGCHMRR